MYKSGYSLKIYQMLENDLINFLNYIPLHYYNANKRKEIFSPKLSELLIRIVSQIDIFFREWDIIQSQDTESSKEKLKFGNYKYIENQIPLSDKEVKILVTNETIMPFKGWIKKDPEWWTSYNSVKHNGFANREKGNLFNVIESLSALFLLNCLNPDTGDKLIEYGYRNLSTHESRQYLKKRISNILISPYIISQLFEFDETAKAISPQNP